MTCFDLASGRGLVADRVRGDRAVGEAPDSASANESSFRLAVERLQCGGGRCGLELTDQFLVGAAFGRLEHFAR